MQEQRVENFLVFLFVELMFSESSAPRSDGAIRPLLAVSDVLTRLVVTFDIMEHPCFIQLYTFISSLLSTRLFYCFPIPLAQDREV